MKEYAVYFKNGSYMMIPEKVYEQLEFTVSSQAGAKTLQFYKILVPKKSTIQTRMCINISEILYIVEKDSKYDA